jgi:Thaumatin family
MPVGWEGTQCPPTNKECGANGPRFYPRTGCKYDITHNLAQCETGSCGDAYDCGKQALRTSPLASSGRTPVSIVEWTFNSQGGQGYEYPDISLVDGVSLTTDVQALGQHCASKPGAPSEPNWLSQNQPLAIHGTDLREATRCIKSFRLTRGEVGQIIRGAGGNPDDVVACFTNCGRYEYPGTPAADCNPDTDPACKYWRDFCCYGPPRGPGSYIYTVENVPAIASVARAVGAGIWAGR